MRCPGSPQSVSRTGSQITNTRTLPRSFRRSTFSTAEAPRRHVVQVGESRTTTRVRSAAASNSRWNAAKSKRRSVLAARTHGFCPARRLEICRGNSSIPSTSAAVNHRRTVRMRLCRNSQRPRMYVWMNAKMSSATDSASSHGLNCCDIADAPADPAAINSVASGRQQLNAARRLASDANAESAPRVAPMRPCTCESNPVSARCPCPAFPARAFRHLSFEAARQPSCRL